MINCVEIIDDVLTITAIPLANIPASDISSLVNQLTPTVEVTKGYFESVLTDAITIGMRKAGDHDALVPIVKKTGKASDSESDSVAGRLHTVTVTCEADSRDNTIWERLLTLERRAHHLLLTYVSGSQAFVAADQDSYLCSVNRDGAKTTVTFRVQNLMGVQTVV